MQDSITKLARDFFHSFSTGKLRLSVARYFEKESHFPIHKINLKRHHGGLAQWNFVCGGLKEWRAVLAPLLTIENLIKLVELPGDNECGTLAYCERRHDIDNSSFIFSVHSGGRRTIFGCICGARHSLSDTICSRTATKVLRGLDGFVDKTPKPR
jgi:hypothetical protein